jgi:Tol biopolymer transport system component
MMNRLKTRNRLGVFLAALGTISALLLFPNVRATIAFSPSSTSQTAHEVLEASTAKLNGRIAFTSTRNGFRDIFLMDPDGSNQRQLTFGSVNPADGFRRTATWSPMWSPDGTKIAFMANLEYKTYNLYIMNADGTRIRKITDANGIDVSNIAWSPDGTKLAFDHACGTTGDSLCPIDIYTVNVDGTGLAKLTTNSPNNHVEDVEPAWSPDGTRIAFSDIRSGDFTSIYVMNPDGNNRMRLTNGSYDHSPSWSPDGTKVAFRRLYDVYVMNADGTNPTPVTAGEQVSADGIAWSPDGARILFNHEVRINQQITAMQVYATNVDGTNQRNLTNSTSTDYLGSWQPRFISATNPVDDSQFFVHQHYLDFLSREPDAAGYAFWTNQITSCGSDAQCIEVKRVNVSASYFLSIEFQESGYLVYRFYNAALNRTNGLPRFIEFMRDTQRVSDGVIVTAPGWQQQLEQNKQAFAQDFVTRPEFTALYPETMTAAQYVDALYQHAGITPTTAERQAALDEFNTPTGARGRVMRRVAENQALYTREFNRAFVLAEYFGYLRRNPDDPPDGNLAGYNFWLNKLTAFHGNYIDAEMVKAFITSTEYRSRFGSP